MTEYIELFKNVWMVFKAFLVEWLPLYQEMEKAAWGPLGNLKDLLGTLTTIGAAILICWKIFKKYH